MRDGRTILPGFMRPAGSNSALISSKARVSRGPNCQATHSLRTRPSPCSPEKAPLYSRTSALASSAIARIFTAPSRRMSRIGRTCSVPTDACAYHVPRVPCLRNTSLNRSTYSARCSSGTAQSSMNDTGLPSPRMLIMMLRPALRTSHSAFCAPASTMRTTQVRQSEVAHQRDQIIEPAHRLVRRVADELHQQDRLRLADERGVDHGPERRIAAREVDHRPVDQLDRRWPQRDDMARAFHRPMERRKIHDAQRAMPGQRRDLHREPARPRKRTFAADQQMREVDAAVGGVRPHALRMKHVDVVAADAAQQRGHPARDLVTLARADRAQPSEQRAHARGAPCISRSRPEACGRAVGEQRVDGHDVVHHVAVGDRPRPARVVAGHAAQRGIAPTC